MGRILLGVMLVWGCGSPPPPSPPPLVAASVMPTDAAVAPEPAVAVAVRPDAAVAAAAPAAIIDGDAGSPPLRGLLGSIGEVTGCRRLALALVVDRSGSMSGHPIEMAKAAAGAAIDRLTRDDCVAVFAFDSTPSRIVPLRIVDDAAAIKAAIGQITAGGGTELLPAIDQASLDLTKATRARRRHVVLLTDGQSPVAGLRDLANAMAAENMTMTTIGLGSSTDEQTLKMLADTAGGRFYRVVDPSVLPRIFARDVDLTLVPP